MGIFVGMSDGWAVNGIVGEKLGNLVGQVLGSSDGAIDGGKVCLLGRAVGSNSGPPVFEGVSEVGVLVGRDGCGVGVCADMLQC